ncbi:hypothetical protein TNCV_1948691 [Trichonephila clavipes]|nr:hypothetical protein TNCV_1948691 [Trichonephila clavipes]
MSHCKKSRGLILKHVQVTRMISELLHSFSELPHHADGSPLILDKFKLLHDESSVRLRSKLKIYRPRVRDHDHKATTAIEED